VPRKKSLQSNFSAGELAPDLWMRQDTDQYQNGAKSLRNRRCLIGGGTKRRPGTWRDIDLPGPSRLEEWIVNRTTTYIDAFGDGAFSAYARDADTGELSAAGSLTNCPWTGDIWREMNMVQSGDAAFLTHTAMWPKVLKRLTANTWSVSDFQFATGPSGRPEQPYLKFADPNYTLTCSDVTGSITLTVKDASGTAVAYFVADHVNTYIRYHKKACKITAVASDGKSCTATVVENLPETYSLTVTSSANFSIGEIVEGDTSGAKAIITAVPDGTHVTCILTDTLIPFSNSETLIGPQTSTTVSGSSTTTNGAVSDWDEQMFSDVYGYPACVELHRNRLLFGGHLTAPDYLAGSALNNLYNFNVGDGSDGDGFLESIGDDTASRIVQLHSAEQLLIGTDKGPYYVPESVSAPFRPSGIAFFPFGSPWPITAGVRFQPFDNGVLMLSGSTVIKASPTGDLTRAWEAHEISLLSHHMISNPDGLAITANFADGPERYAVLRNDDGALAVMQYVEKQNIRNFTPWDTEGTVQSVAAIEANIYQAVTRSIAGNTLYLLERYDQDITLDCATEYATEAAMADMASGVQASYGGTEVHVIADTSYLGTYPLSIRTVPGGPYVVGLYYDSTIETLPPVIEDQEGAKAGDMMRIVEAYAYVQGSYRFSADGYTLSAYQVTDPVDEPPAAKNGAQKFNFLGWMREPTITFNQPDPLPLDILAVRQTVAF
jgi:hypothetical protein